MLRPGLVSVTYRALSPREIVSACVEAGLEGVEWGGDVHVPPGDIKNAREVGQITRDAGLEVAAYGSYYRCDDSPFEPILEAAVALGAPLVRVWAGRVDASDAGESDWARVSDDFARVSELAHKVKVEVVTEFHGGTLTAHGMSALRLMESKHESGFRTLWQPLRRGPNFDAQIEANIEDLRAVEPYLSNVHVYEWADDADGKCQRLSLENSAQWSRYIEELKRIGGERWLLLEFVPGDNLAILAREAAALRGFIGD